MKKLINGTIISTAFVVGGLATAPQADAHNIRADGVDLDKTCIDHCTDSNTNCKRNTCSLGCAGTCLKTGKALENHVSDVPEIEIVEELVGQRVK